MSSEELLREWQDHYLAALRFKSRNPVAVADVLTFGVAVIDLQEGLDLSKVN